MIHYEEDSAEGTATVHFTHVRSFEATTTHGRVDELMVTVPRSAFRASRTNDQRAAEVLTKALDTARDQIERLADERDEWQERAAQLVEERDRMAAQRDEAVHKAASIEALRPVRMTLPPEFFAASADNELKAVIVSQAKEIARLKGESA